MTSEESIRQVQRELNNALSTIQREIRSYPAPIAGCDAQYNYLLGMRGAVKDALKALDVPHFVPTPRELVAGAGIEQR